MTTEQALGNLENLMNVCINRGGIFENATQINGIQESLGTLKKSLAPVGAKASDMMLTKVGTEDDLVTK